MKKILVIDDDVLVLKTIRRLLSMEGYEVTECKSAEESLAVLQSNIFDLAITDIRMPGMDGIQLLGRLRGDEKNKNLPVILLTGYASEEAPIEAFRLNADDYLLKPFNSDQLLMSVRQILERSPAKRSEGEPLLKIFFELKETVLSFKSRNQRKIYEDKTLKEFLESLEEKIYRLEKNFVKLN